jgi:hypothetical protein
MGIERFALIDFDEVQRHNLDRLLGATRRDLGRLKIDISGTADPSRCYRGTGGPGRTCLYCLGTYDVGDVATEREGKLDDPSYSAGLPDDHRFKVNENVFPFSANLGSLEVLHLVALATGTPGIDAGVQRFRTMPGIMERLEPTQCRTECDITMLIGQGDKQFVLYGTDHSASQARERQAGQKQGAPSRDSGSFPGGWERVPGLRPWPVSREHGLLSLLGARTVRWR